MPVTQDLDEVQTFLNELDDAHRSPGSVSADVVGLVEGLSRIVIAADPTFSDPVFVGTLAALATM